MLPGIEVASLFGTALYDADHVLLRSLNKLQVSYTCIVHHHRYSLIALQFVSHLPGEPVVPCEDRWRGYLTCCSMKPFQLSLKCFFHKSTRTVQHTTSGEDQITTQVSLFQLINTVPLKYLLLLRLSRYRKP